MRLTGSRAYTRPTPVPKMPSGLVELMEDLTRDVLKKNPLEVYEFCAEHMRKLLEIRDGPSPKQALTLEQKIARAQEKIRKREDARWQKNLKEKEKENVHSKQKEQKKKNNDENTNVKQLSPTVNSSLKPPVYPDLNTENASEIEISHQTGDVPDLAVNVDKKMDNNNIETNQKEDTSEIMELPYSNKEQHSTIEETHTTNATQNDQYYDAVNEDVTNPNINKINLIDEVTAIKTKEEEHEILNKDENKCEVKENDKAPLSYPPKDSDDSKMKEMLVKRDSEILETTPTHETPPDFKNHNNMFKQKSESKVDNSITDMEKLVNSVVGVHNVLSESSRSPSRNAKYTEDLYDDGKKEKDKSEEYSPAYVEIADLAPQTSSPNDNELLSNTIIKESVEITKKMESENNDKIPDEVQQHIDSENSSNDVQNLQDNICVDKNDKEQSKITIPPVGEYSDKKSENPKKCELDNTTHNMLGENVPSDEYHNLDPPIIHVNDVITDNSENYKLENIVFPGSSEEQESSKEPLTLKHVYALTASNGNQVHGEEPSANILDIHKTRNIQKPNDIIEIRISQVAEALNNEVPLINEDNGKTSEKMSCLVPSKENDINIRFINLEQNGDIQENGEDTGEENEARLLQNSENVDDTPSTISFADNTDDAHNVKTSDTIKSISIDESTDGLDNSRLMESGSSEATDDVLQHSPNNNSMDLETAAVTIQKVFRSFLFKSRASTFDDNEDNISLDEDNEKKDELNFQVANANLNKERRGISRMDTVLQTVNEEKSLSLSTDDSSTLSSAATTIQAHVRGFLVRNKLHSNKTASSNSLVNSDGPSASLEGDIDHKNKTILNIHIVPEGGNYLSRDESMLTSMELSLDGSPPSSLNLHPLGYDRNERRKQLKREDAIQSISPPSNNSGKLSEDSVKDILVTEGDLQTDQKDIKDDAVKGEIIYNRPGSGDTTPTNSLTIETVIEAHKIDQESSDADPETPTKTKRILTKQSSDEMDVVTPFEDKNSLTDSRSTSKLMHSGEFHDIVLPTKVSRSDASVVSEFKNVLVYFLIWNNS